MTLATIKMIELKLQHGVQKFSAQEVATLLNTIRIQQKLLNKKGNK